MARSTTLRALRRASRHNDNQLIFSLPLELRELIWDEATKITDSDGNPKAIPLKVAQAGRGLLFRPRLVCKAFNTEIKKFVYTNTALNLKVTNFEETYENSQMHLVKPRNLYFYDNTARPGGSPSDFLNSRTRYTQYEWKMILPSRHVRRKLTRLHLEMQVPVVDNHHIKTWQLDFRPKWLHILGKIKGLGFEKLQNLTVVLLCEPGMKNRFGDDWMAVVLGRDEEVQALAEGQAKEVDIIMR